MPHPHEPLRLLDGLITGLRFTPEQAGDAPTIVYLHGGGSQASEAVVQLGTAAHNGYPGISLNRPDYLDSASLGLPFDQDEGFYVASAERLDDAIADYWARHAGESRGVVLQGCSVGSAMALIIAQRWARQSAAGTQRWPLLGVAMADIGALPYPEREDLWKTTPVVHRVLDLGPWIEQVDFGPEWARYTAGLGDESPGVPRAEILEYNGGWARNALGIAAEVTVPVLWRVSEFDPFWRGDDEAVAAFRTALETSSPYVDAGVMAGASHAIHDGPRGRSYLFSVLAFVELCRTASITPQTLERRPRR